MRKTLPVREIVYVPHHYEGVYSMLERKIIDIAEARILLGVNKELDRLKEKQ